MKRVLTAVFSAVVAVGAIVAAGIAADSAPSTPKGDNAAKQVVAVDQKDPAPTTSGSTTSPSPSSTAYPPPTVPTEVLAWCSPGFWKNADPAAWDLTGYSKDTLFNDTGAVAYYGAMLGATVTLADVLDTNGGLYKGAPASGGTLNPFNAVGAMLTDALDGYEYGGDSCPVDNHGVIA